MENRLSVGIDYRMNLNNDFKVGTQVPSLKPITFLYPMKKEQTSVRK